RTRGCGASKRRRRGDRRALRRVARLAVWIHLAERGGACRAAARGGRTGASRAVRGGWERGEARHEGGGGRDRRVAGCDALCGRGLGSDCAGDRRLDARADGGRAMSSALELAVWSSAFSMIAEEMGSVLIRGSLSPNIRERRDASCALFDANGQMVAQAAHIPVHLGALPEAVRAVRAQAPKPGDVFLLNSPWAGGSHLPDLTMVEAIAMDGAPGR